MSISGRRPNERLRSIGRGLLEGLDALGTAMNDAPKRERIQQIDTTILELKAERDYLIAGLYEKGDLETSSDYDPHWKPKPPTTSDGGRMTECRGQIAKGETDHWVHPGCPYRGTPHNKHEFTLRD